MVVARGRPATAARAAPQVPATAVDAAPMAAETPRQHLSDLSRAPAGAATLEWLLLLLLLPLHFSARRAAMLEATPLMALLLPTAMRRPAVRSPL